MIWREKYGILMKRRVKCMGNLKIALIFVRESVLSKYRKGWK